MLYDLIGVSKNDFDNFIENINSVVIKEGTHWKHVNPSSHNSVSIKFDKYFIPKLVWDFYKNNAFYPFPILIFIFNMLCIKWDLKDFDKEYGIYKKRRKK